MHGPTCVFWASLTPFAPKLLPWRGAKGVPCGLPAVGGGGRCPGGLNYFDE
jgi:hypothetical protein